MYICMCMCVCVCVCCLYIIEINTNQSMCTPCSIHDVPSPPQQSPTMFLLLTRDVFQGEETALYAHKEHSLLLMEPQTARHVPRVQQDISERAQKDQRLMYNAAYMEV